MTKVALIRVVEGWRFLSGGASASFTYDPFGRRIRTTINSTNTQYLYDGYNPVQQLGPGSTPRSGPRF